jgi:hypothetical protein
VAKPWDADPLAWLQTFDIGSDRIDPPDDFVTRDDRDLWVRQFAIDDMQIRPANATRRDSHSDLTHPRLTVREIGPFKRCS